MSNIKITSQYDINKALVGVNPTQHPEAYRLLKALKGIADAERDSGSIYEIAGNVVSNHLKDTKIAQQTSQIARLQTKLADTEAKLMYSDQKLESSERLRQRSDANIQELLQANANYREHVRRLELDAEDLRARVRSYDEQRARDSRAYAEKLNPAWGGREHLWG